MAIKHGSKRSQKDEITQKIGQLFIQTMKSAQQIMSEDTLQFFQQKIQSERQQSVQPILWLEELIGILLAQIINLQKTLEFYKVVHVKQINEQQYKNLQSSLQKSEAEIRNHIRLEQQLKIYIEELQQKNQQLQNLLHQEKKNAQAFQNTINHLEIQQKDILAKVKHFQKNSTTILKLPKNQSKVVSEQFISASSTYLASIQKNASKKKDNKLLLHWNNTKKKQYNSQLRRLESSINVSLHQEESKRLHTQAELREYTKTVQLNTSKKPIRMLVKRKQQYSNSKSQLHINRNRCESGLN